MNLLTRYDKKHIYKKKCRNFNEMKDYFSDVDSKVEDSTIDRALNKQLNEISECYYYWKNKVKETDAACRKLRELQKALRTLKCESEDYKTDVRIRLFYRSAYYKECQKQLVEVRKKWKKAMSAVTIRQEERDRKRNFLKTVHGKEIFRVRQFHSVSKIICDFYFRGDDLTEDNIFEKIKEAFEECSKPLSVYSCPTYEFSMIIDHLDNRYTNTVAQKVDKAEKPITFDFAKFNCVKNGYPGSEKFALYEFIKEKEWNGGPRACEGFVDWIEKFKTPKELSLKHTFHYWDRFYDDWQKGISPKMKKKLTEGKDNAED